MLNKDILEIKKQLREDCPDFQSLESLSPSLATDICYWIKEDRIHTMKRAVKNVRRIYRRKENLNKIKGK